MTDAHKQAALEINDLIGDALGRPLSHYLLEEILARHFPAPSEGTSEQASPTPDKCPKCNSADRSGHITAWAGLEAVYCQDSFHTPKGTK
jgi:hypothetical protein